MVERTDRLLAITRRLAQENALLRTQLAEAHSARAELQARMTDARARVEQALTRLPALTEQEG